MERDFLSNALVHVAGNEAGLPASQEVCLEQRSARWDDAALRCVRAAGFFRLCARTRGTKRVVIVFIDGAADLAHASLRKANIVVVDWTRTTSLAAREHATFIASTLAGVGPQCLGLAPECVLLNVGVVDNTMLADSTPPRENARRLAKAVDLAVARGARIIQISLDLSFQGTQACPLVTAVEAAVARGAIVVLAAGHRPLASLSTLLLASGVISVSGRDRCGQPLHSVHSVAALSATAISAPAIDIPGAVLPGGTALRTGTSFAACFVTAAVALICSAQPKFSPRDAARLLLEQRRVSHRDALPIPLDVDGCFDSLSIPARGHQ